MISVLVASAENTPQPGEAETFLFLTGQEDLQVLGGVTTKAQVLQALQALEPDVLLLDCRLLDTKEPEELKSICSASPGTKVLLLSDVADLDCITDILQGNAKGVLTPTSRPEDYAKAIRAVHNGDFWVGRKFLVGIVERLLGSQEQPATGPELSENVTDREKEIIQFVAQGMTNKEIAKEMGISDKTVKAHLSHIYRKLKVNRRLKLLRAKR